MIEVQNISKNFTSRNKLTKRKETIKALDKVSFTVNDGEVFGVLGNNGAGKTTLLRCMVALIKPDSGVINYGGTKLIAPNGA